MVITTWLPLSQLRINLLMDLVLDEAPVEGRYHPSTLRWSVVSECATYHPDRDPARGRYEITPRGRQVLEATRKHPLCTGRTVLGGSMIYGGGPRYGTTARCGCGGWSGKSNETPSKRGIRDVTGDYRLHLIAVLAEMDEAGSL